MVKRYKITEEQYKAMLDEGVTVQGVVDSNGKADIAKTKQDLTNSGLQNANVKVQFDSSAITEGKSTKSRLITKSELSEHRRKYLKENSQVFTFNNFLNNLK